MLASNVVSHFVLLLVCSTRWIHVKEFIPRLDLNLYIVEGYLVLLDLFQLIEKIY